MGGRCGVPEAGRVRRRAQRSGGRWYCGLSSGSQLDVQDLQTEWTAWGRLAGRGSGRDRCLRQQEDGGGGGEELDLP
jgi:hypothetical protein